MKHNTKLPRRSENKRSLPVSKRATLTPEEFAAEFRRKKTWAYRLFYAGKIKAITGYGNMVIPRTEIDRILESAKSIS